MRRWALIAVVLLVVGALYIGRVARPGGPAAGDTGAAGDAKPAAASGAPAQTRFEGTTLVGWFRGTRQWEMEVDEVRLAETEQLTFLSGIRDGVVLDGEKVLFTVAAREGEWNEASGRLTLRGDVRLVGKDGQRLTTDQIVYDATRRELVAAASTRLVLPVEGKR